MNVLIFLYFSANPIYVDPKSIKKTTSVSIRQEDFKRKKEQQHQE